MERIGTILKRFISERIPSKATNIFFQMFNGIEAMFSNLEYRLDIFKRENNILTAQNISSLRNLAAQNGVEPTLRIASKGILLMKISPKLFSRVGYPLFIKPYAVFTNKLTKIDYLYVSDKTIRIDGNSSTVYIPVVEGTLKQVEVKGSIDYIQRIYLEDSKISDGSIIVEVNGEQFTEVKSFYDNYGVNKNKQFLLKWSMNPQYPIILYLKGHQVNQTINITYRLTNGELGNLSKTQKFETESIVDSYGSLVTPTEDEISIINVSGFTLGSNGTDENALRSAIGYNHSQEILFDNASYRNFIGKFSTLCLQDIKVNREHKQINNIYLWKKICFDTNSTPNIIPVYKSKISECLSKSDGFLSEVDKHNISGILSENEYCLSSHNLFQPFTNRYAFQIMFDSINDMELHKNKIEEMLYFEFSKFMYTRFYTVNIEELLHIYMKENSIHLTYLIFDAYIESKKIHLLHTISDEKQLDYELKKIEASYIIQHKLRGEIDTFTKKIVTTENSQKPYQTYTVGPWLPLLFADFPILVLNPEINSNKYIEMQLKQPVTFVVRTK